jgi:amino acid adenylation domain-containing protein
MNVYTSHNCIGPPTATSGEHSHHDVLALFANSARTHSQAVAIAGPRRLTYSELEAESDRQAQLLKRSGAARRQLVATCFSDRIDAIVAMIAIMKAGCVHVPLDASASATRLSSMLAVCKPDWLITDSLSAPKVGPAVLAANPQAKTLDLLGDTVPFAGVAERTESPTMFGADDLAAIYFTSGSTGAPKAIATRFSAIGHFAKWEIATLGVSPGARISQLAAPAFDAFLKDVWTPLCAGGTVCVPSDLSVRTDGDALLTWLTQERVHILHCVPSLFRAILAAQPPGSAIPGLTDIVLAGEQVFPSDIARWTRLFGTRIRLLNLYGPTETAVTKLFYFIQPQDGERSCVPIGKPMEGAEVLILDKSGRPCPIGVAGEIHIRTPYRALGYYNQPARTAESFIANPLTNDPQDILYKTGDYGRFMEDGNTEFLGRKDAQVKIHGVRVELGEIEHYLRRYPTVRDAVVTYTSGADGPISLCAYLIAPTAEVGQVRTFLAEHLPEYMIPAHLLVVDEFPRTPNGKIDRKELVARYPPLVSSNRLVSPRTRSEGELVELWKDLLGLEQVSIDDNFFQVGGHSLIAMRLLARVRRQFGVEVPLTRFLDNPTIVSLAEGIEETLVKTIPQEKLEHLVSELRSPAPGSLSNL